MSASFSSEDKDWLKTIIKWGHFHPEEIAILESVFDEQTDYDVEAISKQLTKEKFLRKVCLYKLLLFPIEYLIILLLLGTKRAADHHNITKSYYKFFKKKISLTAFQKELQKAMKEA